MMKANLFESISVLDFWLLHAVILVPFELLPFSFKFGSNSSLSNSHDGGGWGMVVVGGGGGSADENIGAVLLSMSVWC